MAALILADGDVPPRSELDLLWPGWDDGVKAVIAADARKVRECTAGTYGEEFKQDPAVLERAVHALSVKGHDGVGGIAD